jgi:integrase
MKLKAEAGHCTVPLPSFAVNALQNHRWNQMWLFEALEGRLLRPDDFVFTGVTCKPLDARNVNRAFKQLLREAEAPNLRFHDLRHTCATLLLAQGVQPKEVQEILGHCNIGMTMEAYGHAISDAKRKAANLVDTFLGA